MMNDNDWLKDLARYPQTRPFFKEQSIWAVWVYRFGRRVDIKGAGLSRKVCTIIYWLMFRVVETITGISLPKSAIIGGGLRVWHFGGIFINPDVIIGKNCTLRQGITVGNRKENGPVPVIGDDVDIGAYAQILGRVRVGNNCKIGAMSVVLCDVPDGATAVGNPARIILKSVN